MRPKVSTAHWMIFPAEANPATLSPFAIASPPAFLISATTSFAGAWSPPSPDSDTPMSFTTTFAPCCAISFAIAAPMPRPAPVTTTTFPSTSLAMIILPFSVNASANLGPAVIEHRRRPRRHGGAERHDVSVAPHLRAHGFPGIYRCGKTSLHRDEARGIVAAQGLQYGMPRDAEGATPVQDRHLV